VTPEDARARLYDVAVLWGVGYVVAVDVVDAACDALVAGLDGPSLRILAGVSRRHADEEVPEIVEAALRDVDLPSHPRASQDAEEAAIRVLAARVLAGLLAPCGLTGWAFLRYGHDTQPLAERLVELDELYELVEHSETTHGEIDADVRAEARRIVQTSSLP